MTRYYLRSENINSANFFDGWYTGKDYIHNAEIYAVCDNHLENCKEYSSYNRARNACNKLNNRCCNYYFTVDFIEE